MLKNRLKIVVFLVVAILFLSTISFATEIQPRTTEAVEGEPVTISEDNPVAIAEDEDSHNHDEITEDDIHNGDLYLFDNNVVMDKLVDGNVFIMGQNVEITGKVNGSLFVVGNKVTISEDSYIVQTLYSCSNELVFNGAATDIYAAGNRIDISTNSFIIRDLRVACDTLNFAGGVGRDAFVRANTFKFATSEEHNAIVYGNLDYSCSSELDLSEDLVNGTITYKQLEKEEEKEPVSEIILDKIVNLCQTLVYTAVVFVLILWLAPNFAKQASSYVGKESFKCFGVGVLGFVTACIGAIILLITYVGVPVAISGVILFGLMMAISFAITAICISYKVKEKYALEKKNMYILILMLVSTIIWLLELIPFIGAVITMLVSLFGFGTIIVYIFNNHKIGKTKEAKESK